VPTGLRFEARMAGGSDHAVRPVGNTSPRCDRCVFGMTRKKRVNLDFRRRPSQPGEVEAKALPATRVCPC
jgi:hypothetical protein